MQKQKFKFKLNKKYYLEVDEENGTTKDADFLIVREDRFTYYIVDNISIDQCDDKDEKGLIPLFEVDKFIDGNTYKTEEVEARIVKFLHSMGVRI